MVPKQPHFSEAESGPLKQYHPGFTRFTRKLAIFISLCCTREPFRAIESPYYKRENLFLLKSD